MKRFVLFSMLFFAFFSLNALEVNQPELESVGKDTIEFINYTGPHSVINTKDEIAGIGSALGEKVAPNVANKYETGDNNKYFVIHAVDSTVNVGLDADILILGKNANVDHIKNLRSIISSYLVSAYNYSKDDADTLAVFITVYNAVYRNDLDTYKSKYKEVVTNNLTKESCGISVNYKDWAGNTQLVIPLLNPVDGGLSTIDTTIISDSTVIESMREEDERGVDERKNLVDLKEREADVAQEEAKDAQKEATVAKQLVGITQANIVGSITHAGQTYEIKKIIDYAFLDCTELVSVTMASSITYLGNNAFEGCTSLTEIALSTQLEHIGDRAFIRCNKLASIVIPASVQRIGQCAFYPTESLEDIIFEASSNWRRTQNIQVWWDKAVGGGSGIGANSKTNAKELCGAIYSKFYYFRLV